MIRYIKHHDIDRSKWDDCIRSAVNSRIYAFSWYLDLTAGTQWDALADDDYRSVCPLPFRRKWGISYIFTPFFIQQLGIFSKETLDQKTQNDFLDAIPSSYKLIELNLNTGNTPDDATFTYAANRNFELTLHHPYDVLRNQYSENLKRNLKKALGENLKIVPGNSPYQVIELFRNERGKLVHHWRDLEYQSFKNLTNRCSEIHKTVILSAFNKENKFIAGAVFFVTETRAVFIFSATGSQAKAGGAMAAIIDTFIRENAGKPLILDFEGSNDPGLARFYAGFGAEETQYVRAVRNRLSFPVRLIRRIKK